MAFFALSLCAPSAVFATALPSTIKENMTLTEAGSPYTGSEVTIESGVTVKAQPGATIKVTKMIVNGTLNGEGTAESPVLFTSSNLFPSPGNWKDIVFNSGSGGSTLEYTEVRYAGSTLDMPAIEIKSGASPTITHSTVKDSKYTGIRVTEGGSPVISYNTLRSNGNHGVYYLAGSSDTGKVNIHDNLAESNSFNGIAVSIVGSGVTSTSLGGNELIKNGHEGLSYGGPDIPPDIDENTLSGNKYEYENIQGTLIQSATWEDRGYPLYLSSEVTIASSATLTLDAGMTVTPYSTSKIVVNGTLNTEGTAESPVRFTSTKASPAAGDWKNIVFNSGSGGVLNYAEVRYGGSGLDMAAIEVKGGASPMISHSTASNNKYSGIKVTEGGSAVISYDTLRSNGNYGAYYVAGSTNSGTVNIHDNLAEGNSFAGIAVAITGTGVSATSLGSNELIKNGQAGLTYIGPDVPPDIDDNTLSENKTNQIEIKGTLVKSGSWKSRGYPFIVSGELIIGSEATLTLEAGFTMKMASTARVVVNGTLNAEGTAENPARVISSKESPAAGDWKNIVFNSGSGGSVFEYAEVRYGGSNTDIAAIEITGGAGPTIKNSTIANNKFSGIKATEGGAPEIAYNALISNGNYGAYYVAGSKNSGAVNIHDNLAEGNSFSGIAVSVVGEGATSTSLGGNVLVGNGSDAIRYGGPDVPVDLDENTLSENGSNVVEVQGTVSKSASWNDRGFPFFLEGDLTVGGSGSLTLGAGITVKAASGRQIVVNGALNTEGTAEDAVLFTSSKESGPGDWKNIVFESGSGSSVLDHAVVRYAGSGVERPAIEVNGASPTITHSALRQNANVAIKVISGSPKITWNSFTSNGSGLTYKGEGKLLAPHNYWGCASGPAPAGCGNEVSENVEWEPQAEEDSGLGQCRGKESQCGEGADPVSLATGALNYAHRDLRLTNKGRTPLQFVRTYNSADSSDSGLGRGWSQSGLANATELENGDVLVRRQDGRQDVFEATESGYKAPSGITDKLSKVEGGFRLTTLQNSVYDFNASGRIAQITDDHGLKTTYGYNGSGLLTTITDPSGQTLTLSYNGSNHITAVKDSAAREVKYAYSGAGDLESVTDAVGGVTKYAYDGQHRMTSITDPKANVILKNTYDSEGRIIEQKDGLENLWKLTYSAGKTVVTEPEGGKLTYGFDSHNRVTSETDQLGHETAKVYDSAGSVSEVIQPGGGKWALGHDAEGNLTSVEDPEGGERSYEYDGQNRLTAFTDALGNTWEYEWSEANDLVKVTDPEEGETTLAYDEAGLPTSIADPLKHETTFSYDSRGNRLSVTDPLEGEASYEYNSRNYLISKTLPGQESAEALERNALGDLLAATTPEVSVHGVSPS